MLSRRRSTYIVFVYCQSTPLLHIILTHFIRLLYMENCDLHLLIRVFNTYFLPVVVVIGFVFFSCVHESGRHCVVNEHIHRGNLNWNRRRPTNQPTNRPTNQRACVLVESALMERQ